MCLITPLNVNRNKFGVFQSTLNFKKITSKTDTLTLSKQELETVKALRFI